MTLLDIVSAKLATDPARWPDRRGDYHADCPYCNKPAKKGQTHFRISHDGLCYCQVCQSGTTLTALADHLGVKAERNGATPQTEYSYYDANGVLLYQAVRYYKADGKHFYQRRPAEDGKWINKLDTVPRVLYRLPEVIAAVAKGERIYIVEGEKDVEMLRMRGLVATTNVGGAGKWAANYSEVLRGADVVVLPDNDRPGDEHASDIRRSLRGIVKSVKVIRLPNLPDKGDVSDWLAMGHTTAELEALIEEKTKPPELRVDRRREGITLRELQHKVFDPERWIIEAILPEGACLFAAKYKSKKSWMALALSLAIAMGGRALGRLNVSPGRVLYLDLEGKQQRIQKRTRAMLGVQQVDWPANFHIFTKWPQGDEGIKELEYWFVSYPDTALVVTDVLASFRRPMAKHEEVYRYDRDTIDPLNELAERYHAANLLVHHFNKGKHDDIMDSITGSTGIPSAVNTMWGLSRDVNDSSITILHLRGRDLETDDPLALRWDTYLNQHIIEGNAAEVATSAERRAIITALSDDQQHTPKDIATVLGKPVTAVQFLLRRLLNEGLIDKVGYGKYALIPQSTQTPQSTQSTQSAQSSDTNSEGDRPTLSGSDLPPQSSVKHQEDLNGNSEYSERDSNGSSFSSLDDHPFFTNVPRNERFSLRIYLRGQTEKDQEIAQARCKAYDLDYEEAVKISKAM